ncbi:MAG: Holliday junction resolvase RuvX [Candidatus Eisenbacteria bacterium]
MAVVLGIDWGERRVGVAVSDPEGIVALSLGVLDGSDPKAVAAEIAALARERGAERIVVGLPRNMDGTLGPVAEAALRFRDLLAEVLTVPVETWDERLSSAEAERLIRDAESGPSRPGDRRPRRRGGTPKKRKEKSRVDRIAAVIILQSWLDRRGGGTG